MKKILMVLMGLEIGGAETHVVELSLTLQKRGWEVLVAICKVFCLFFAVLSYFYAIGTKIYFRIIAL